MCTGRVDPAFVLRSFLNGADSVFVGGCWPGECHYTTEGNYHALGMMHLTRRLLKHIGVNPERLRVEWVGASEGIRFAELMNDVVKKVKTLGPLGTGGETGVDAMKLKIEAVKNLLPYIKLVERERLRVPFDTVEEYNKFFASDEVEKIFREMIVDKLAVSEIMLLLREGPLSSGEISEVLGLDRSDVSRHLNNSVRQGLVRFDEKQKALLPLKVKAQARA
jgi:F420-non-reducing hydrogenase iron-sulfur subunit